MTDTALVGRAESLDGDRHYYHPVSGETFPSVTTIIGATTSKPWLTAWSAKLAAEWAVDHLGLVMQTVGEAGRTAAVDLVKGAAKRKREVKADTGDHVHKVIRALILGGPLPDLPEHLHGEDYDGEPLTADLIDDIVSGFTAFTEDHDVDYHLAEATVFNVKAGYAGTLDSLATLRKLGLRLGIDAKSGAHLDAMMRPQGAAYFDPDCEVALPHGELVPLPTVDGFAVLHLRREYTRGYKLFFVSPEELAEARAWFAVMQDHYTRQQAAKAKPGRVLYPPLADGSQPAPLIEDVDGLGRWVIALSRAGIRDLDQLAAYAPDELLAIKGVGPAAVTAINAVIRAALTPLGAPTRTEVA
jgi:hypothetical protein